MEILGQSNGSGSFGVYGYNASAVSGSIGVYGFSMGGIGVKGEGPQWGGYFEGKGYFSGDLGIGSTSPGQKLDVNGNITANRYYDRNNTNYYVDPASTSYINDVRANIFYDRNNTSYYVDPASSGTSAKFAGSVTIGTTSTYDKLNVNGDIKATGILLADGDGGIWDGSAYWRIYAYGNTYLNGGTYQGSDIRFKKNITPIENALDKVSQLRGVSYEFKKDEFPERGFSDGTQIGLIGQELEKVFPEFVKDDMEGYKSVAYDRITAVLIEAVKEQQTEIEQLKQLVCIDHPESEICN